MPQSQRNTFFEYMILANEMIRTKRGRSRSPKRVMRNKSKSRSRSREIHLDEFFTMTGYRTRTYDENVVLPSFSSFHLPPFNLPPLISLPFVPVHPTTSTPIISPNLSSPNSSLLEKIENLKGLMKLHKITNFLQTKK